MKILSENISNDIINKLNKISLKESYSLNIFNRRPCPKCDSFNFKRVIDKEDSDGTQHFHYTCPDCDYEEEEEEYNPSVDELNLKIFKQYFNNYINTLEINDDTLKKVNDYAKQELKDIGNSSSDIENAFADWNKDYWMIRGLDNKESSYSNYASILERKYNLTKDESLYLAYCIKCIKDYYLKNN